MSTETKKKNLTSTIERLEKQYGKGIVMKMGDKPRAKVNSFPSGSLLLDAALGVGGFPAGRIIEIYGPESSGKTTLTLHAIAEVQKQGGVCAFIDAEHALDIHYAKKIGIDVSALYISQPSDGEQALEIADQLIQSQAISLVVIDSVAALVPRAEIEGNMGDAQVALQARLMSQAMRKLTGVLSKSNTTIIFINQLRMKVGYVFGNPETTSGGNALKFYSSVRIDVRRMEQLKRGDENIGCRMKIKVVKNKVAPPFRQAETTLIYGEGISLIYEVIEAGVKFNIIQKSGSWYSYNDERLSQGQENLKNFLLENQAIFKDIEKKVRERLAVNDDLLDDGADALEKGKGSSQKKPATSAKEREEKKAIAASKKIAI